MSDVVQIPTKLNLYSQIDKMMREAVEQLDDLEAMASLVDDEYKETMAIMIVNQIHLVMQAELVQRAVMAGNEELENDNA